MSDTDAIPRGLVPRDFLDEEGGIRLILLLPTNHILEVGFEDIVPQDEHEAVVDMILDRKKRV